MEFDSLVPIAHERNGGNRRALERTHMVICWKMGIPSTGAATRTRAIVTKSMAT